MATRDYEKLANINFKNWYVHTYKSGETRLTACGRKKFPNMSLEQAHDVYIKQEVERLAKLDELFWKREMFERWLICVQGLDATQSRISESRYYYYGGYKFRFSSHVYPTGSMSNDILNVVDLCADYWRIDEILTHFNLLDEFNKQYKLRK